MGEALPLPRSGFALTEDRPLVTISEVSLPTARPSELADFGLGFPEPGSAHSVYSFPVQGWAVGARSPARAIDVHGAQRRLPRLPVSISRPDIGSRWPDIAWADECGFAARLSVVHLPRQFRLELSLLFEDGARANLGVIEGERQPLPATSDAQFRPLLITTLGRSGSTWLTWLLGKHPEIMDYRSFEYEPKVGSYFAEVVRVLTQPSSYYQALRGDIDPDGWWLGRSPNYGLPWYSSEPAVDEWLGASYVEDLIAFFAQRIDGLYAKLAEATGKSQAVYFVEKFPPVYFAQRMLREIYPEAREIFLVRDFRDVACSILAFGDKRGLPWYWLDGPASDEELVRERLGDEVEQLLASWAERSNDAFLLRYEDLIDDRERTLSALFDHLRVDGSARTVRKTIEVAADLDPDLLGDHLTSSSPSASVGRWRKELDPSLVRVCEESLGDALAAFGYS
jgi:hypothetical protein